MKQNNARESDRSRFTSTLAGIGRHPARLLLAAVLLTALVHEASAQVSWSLGGAWFATNGIGHLGNASLNRGLAYSAVSNQVFVATRAAATTGSIDVFDGATGALLSGAGGVTGANLGIDQIGIADDGTLYGVPLNTGVSGSSLVTVYAWTNWNSTPYVAYQSSGTDPVGVSFAGKRIGDTMAVRGSGANTLMLAAVSGYCTNFVLLHTTDGITFTATAITNVPGLPPTSSSSAGNFVGMCFYTNGTFLVQPGSGAANRNVYLVSYPANFASQTAVSGTLLGNVAALTASPNEWLDYSPAGQMLAAIQAGASTQNAASLFSLTNFPASVTQLATTNFLTPNVNGNATGGAALGGQGKTNYLYVLESNNGLEAYTINFSTGPIGPSISTQPVGVSNAYPPQTLTVTVAGTPPFHYQWYQVSGGVTNPVGANTNFYIVSTAVTNSYFVVITNAALTANSVTSVVVGMSLFTPVSNPVVTPLWSLGIGAYPFLANDNNTRGLAYDTNLNRVVVASQSGGAGLYILDGTAGTNMGSLSTSGMYSGGVNSWLVDQVGIADDGAVYAGNLATVAGTFALTRWPAATNGAAGVAAYGPGDPGSGSGDRWGDNLAARGTGAGTQILVPSKGTNVALFTTGDGLTFAPLLIAITNVPAGFAGNGVAFGAGNTFWAKKYLGDLYEIAFDPVALVGGVVLDFSVAGQIPSTMSGVGVDPANNIVAGVSLAERNNDLQLFQLTGTADPPVLFSQSFFPSFNANGNQNAAIAMKFPRAYALDVNNGIVAVTYGTPATTPPTITAPPASQTVFTNDPAVILSVGVSGSLPLYFQWRFNGANIPNATNRNYTLAFPPLTAAGNYDVVVHNIAGTKTSTPPAVLTVVTPVASPTVTPLWTLAAGSRSYLDSSLYNLRGLAYDTNTANLLLCDHAAAAIYVLSGASGGDLFTLNTIGLPNVATFPLDQIGVADDGVVYGANLALTANGDKFAMFRWGSVDAGAIPTFAYGDPSGADPSNGSGDRWGDTMAVRGAGVNTEILFGSLSGTNVLLFTTADGSTFTPIVIAVTNTPGANGSGNAGPVGLGIAFGAGDTFWVKSPGYNLRHVSYDKNTGLGGVFELYTAGTQIDSSMDGISVDVANNVLAGVVSSDTPNDVALYQLSGSGAPPALFQQEFFSSVNPNSQQNAVTTLKGGLGFGLDVNNGLVAFSYQTPPVLPLDRALIQSALYQTGSVALTWATIPGRTYQVQYRGLVDSGDWINVGPVLGSIGPRVSYMDTTATAPSRFYRVQVQ